MTDEAVGIGRKIAQRRVRLGYSQREFGSLVDRSETWVSQVERGVRRVDRLSVLERLADALDMPITELAPDVAAAVEAVPSSGAAREISLALTSSNALRGVLARQKRIDPGVHQARASEMWAYAHAAQHDQVGGRLSQVIADMETAARSAQGDDQRAVFASLAQTYQAAASVLAELGEVSGAWVASDRAIAAAERAGDPLLMGEGAFRLTLVFLAANSLDMATNVAETAVEALRRLRESGRPEAISVWGALTLQLSVIAARQNDADTAYGYLQAAEDAAIELGEGRNDYDTEFGPTNVALHEVAVAVDLGDAGRAIRVGEEINASHLSPERQARLLIDLARAHTQMRNVERVVDCLRGVESVAPEQFHAHPMIRQVLADLMSGGLGSHPAVRALVADLEDPRVDR